MPLRPCSRRQVVTSLIMSSLLPLCAVTPAHAATPDSDEELMKKFRHLSENGNSNCSGRFMRSIATMPAGARLQGSCCAPMDAHRYIEQVRTLRKYRIVPEIPPDPYDVPAELARKLMADYDAALGQAEQTAYAYAMENSDEKGPCCCQCWRWYVYGGLGKYLLREKRFDGPALVDVWNLSSGCGGGAEHHH